MTPSSTLAPPEPSAWSRAAPEPGEPPDTPGASSAAPSAGQVTGLPAGGDGEVRALAESLARCVVEVLAGTREIDQIARWLSSDVHAHLLKRVVLSARARTARGESPTRPSFSMGTTVLCEPTPGVVEAVVIVHGRARSRAVALRLESLGHRWRASAIHVL